MGGEIRNLDVAFYSDQGYMGTSSHRYQGSIDWVGERPTETPKMYYVIYERPLVFKCYKKDTYWSRTNFLARVLAAVPTNLRRNRYFQPLVIDIIVFTLSNDDEFDGRYFIVRRPWVKPAIPVEEDDWELERSNHPVPESSNVQVHITWDIRVIKFSSTQ